MRKFVVPLLTVLFVSMFFFPITFSFLPFTNTKNIFGIIGLSIIAVKVIKSGKISIPVPLMILAGLASLVSLIALFSTVYNNTSDMAYATYIITMLIWLGAATTTCYGIRLVHGTLSVSIISNYIIGVCVYQCVMAMLIEYVPAVQAFVDTWIMQGQEILKDMDRLYGVGASLDTAGTRFSICLVLLCGAIRKDTEEGWRIRQWAYIGAFIVIAIIGNMIARTTSTGLILGIIYLILSSDFWKMNISKHSQGLLIRFFICLIIFIPIIVLLYRTNESFHDFMRFGFEGFFSLAETGEWNVRSNTALESMVVFPDNLKTWIIGDGYFSSPNGDLNYLGDLSIQGFYMGTDIGYLRFIFYFGVIGLIAFSAYLYYAFFMCAKNFNEYKYIFLFILISNFVVWLKVATDAFLIFALFISAFYLNEKESQTDVHAEIDLSI